jgi:pimeloyl-[acyl-carrier protein] methyl ester esterase
LSIGRDNGKDPLTLFFIHGWATDGSVWEGIAGHFRDMCNIVNLSLPGHNGEGPWDTPTLKPAVDCVIKGLKGVKGLVIGIGWSLGGTVIIESQIASRGRFTALILISSTPCFTEKRDFSFGQRPSLVRRMIMDARRDPAITLRRFYCLNFTEEEMRGGEAKGFVERYSQKAEGLKGADIGNSLEALGKADIRDDLSAITTPTLVLHGGEDPVVKKEAGRCLADNIKGAEYIEAEGAGHAPFVTNPGLFIKHMEEFVRRTMHAR